MSFMTSEGSSYTSLFIPTTNIWVVQVVSTRMPEKITTNVKLDALIMHAKGVKQEAVASAYGISESTLKRAKARYAKYGDLEAGYKIPGRKPLFGPCMRDVYFNFSHF
jgi:Helix-turn-helix domain